MALILPASAQWGGRTIARHHSSYPQSLPSDLIRGPLAACAEWRQTPGSSPGEATVGVESSRRYLELPTARMPPPSRGRLGGGPSTHATSPPSPLTPNPALSSSHCLHTPAGRANRLVKGQMGRGCRDSRGTAEVLLSLERPHSQSLAGINQKSHLMWRGSVSLHTKLPRGMASPHQR